MLFSKKGNFTNKFAPLVLENCQKVIDQMLLTETDK